ncbi:MAG: beta-ketoacyl-ACP synthase I, partial [Gammaproteobacteria bacterium]|nr:beta-ketoacyl-ACP synthase I [Gammaproteobacteria bacterium]
MRRVVVTGLGAVSCLGNSQADILASLKNGRSGIVANESFAEMGLRSQVAGAVDIDVSEHIDRKVLRFMGDSAAYSYISMQQAIDDAGLEEGDISNVRTGLIASSGGASSREIVRAADVLRSRGVRKIGPYSVTKTMSS